MADELIRQVYFTLLEARGQAYIAWMTTRPIDSEAERVAHAWWAETVTTFNKYETWLEQEKGQLLTSLKAGRQSQG